MRPGMGSRGRRFQVRQLGSGVLGTLPTLPHLASQHPCTGLGTPPSTPFYTNFLHLK